MVKSLKSILDKFSSRLKPFFSFLGQCLWDDVTLTTKCVCVCMCERAFVCVCERGREGEEDERAEMGN